MKYNQLKDKLKFQLYDWAKEHESMIRTSADKDSAAAASAALGFTVSESNIEGLRNNLGWAKRIRIDSPQTAQALSDRITELESAQAAVERAIDRLLPAGWRHL